MENDKTNGQKLDELTATLQTNIELLRSIPPANVYNRVQHYEGVARAITRVGIMALAGALTVAMNEPRFLYLCTALYFTRAPKAARASTAELIGALSAKVDALAK